MNRRTMFGAGASAVLAARVRAANAQTTPAPAPIRIAVTLNDSGLCPLYAQEQGFFRQAGLNVELTTFANASHTAEALMSGTLEVGIVDAVVIANAYIHGLPIAAFAAGCAFSKTSPTLVVVTAKSGAIRVPRDLENQTVGVVALKSLSSSSLLEWLRVNGADPAKVKLYELTFPDMNAALERGTIAAALQGEPFLSAAKTEQRALGVPFEALGKPFYVNLYAASRTWLANNGPLARRIAAALYDTARWANTHRPDSAAIESRFTKLPLDTVNTMARNVFATSFDPQLMEPVLDLGARYGLTERPVHAAEIAVLV